MKMRDARTIEPEALEDRRKQAIQLHLDGWKNVEIAPKVGVHRNTVGQWIQAWRAGGQEALAAGKAGRPAGSGMRLQGHQAATIVNLITDKTPDQLKFPFALWSREAVQELIKDRFGIDLPIRTVGEYLKRWGFTVQKPVVRAYERNDQDVKRWLEEEYPQIEKAAKADGAEIQWGDETGIRSDHVTGTGYAPCGQAPVQRQRGAPEKTNMISTITNKGRLRFRFFDGRLNADLFIDFLERLITDSQRKIHLIVDRHPVHCSHAVRDWVDAHADRLQLHFLPSYSPELNPDEHLNSDLKSQLRKQPHSRQKGHLKKNAKATMEWIEQQPDRIRSYFQAPPVQYAA